MQFDTAIQNELKIGGKQMNNRYYANVQGADSDAIVVCFWKINKTARWRGCWLSGNMLHSFYDYEKIYNLYQKVAWVCMVDSSCNEVVDSFPTFDQWCFYL